MSNTLANFWQGICGASVMAFAYMTPFLRRRRISWGTKDNELYRKLPGDQIISTPGWQYTQAISINASPDKIWPWLVQIGQGRGGFYSYEMLENLVGCHIRNADRIIPEYQKLIPGENIKLHPEVACPVEVVDEGKTIILHYDSRAGRENGQGAIPVDYFETTWAFYIESQEDQSSRLISRFRVNYNRSLRSRIAFGYFVEPVSTTMQTGMLRGIKKRVEKFKNPAV